MITTTCKTTTTT